MGLVRILSVALSPVPADRLLGFGLDAPTAGTGSETYAFEISGWVQGGANPVVAVEVFKNEEKIRVIPVSASGRGGFEAVIGVIGLPPRFEMKLQASLQDGASVLLATICGEHQPLRTSYRPSLQPLMITSLARTGTTWLMRILAEHPRIVACRAYPYEVKSAANQLQLLKSQLDGLATATGVEQLAASVQRSIEEFYRQVAGSQGQTSPVYFAEKHLPGGLPWLVWELYPSAREIFLVRDFRDMLCSILAFNAKRGTAGFGRQHVADDQAYVQRLETRVARLVRSWKARSERAHLVHYEDLVTHPAGTIAGVLEYLGLERTDSTVQAMLDKASEPTQELQQHRTSRDAEASIGRWREDLDDPLKAVCRAAFGEALTEFGYAV
jgi:hypothetical protein